MFGPSPQSQTPAAQGGPQSLQDMMQGSQPQPKMPQINPPSTLGGMMKQQQDGGQQQQGGQQGGPSYDQVQAASHYLHSVNTAIEPLIKDDMLGKENIRPKMFDVAARLIGDRIVSLPEAMNYIKTMPDNPAEQKVWLLKLYQSNKIAQDRVLDDYMASGGDPFTDKQGSAYSQDTHGKHIKELMNHYG